MIDDKIHALILAADLAYSEMAFTLHDIVDPRRREDDDAWIDRRGRSLADKADKLRSAINQLQSESEQAIY